MSDFGLYSTITDSDFNSIAIVGSSSSGKTYFTRYILGSWYSSGKFDYYYCLSGTIGENGLKNNFHPKLFKILTIENFNKFITVAKKLGKDGKKGLLIIDDMSTISSHVRSSELLTSLWTEGRHWGVTVISCIQSPMMIPKNARLNIAVWIIFPVRRSKLVTKDLVDWACFGNEHEFKALVEQIESQARFRYGLVVFKVPSKLNGLPDGGYMKVKAPEKVPGFIVGCNI